MSGRVPVRPDWTAVELGVGGGGGAEFGPAYAMTDQQLADHLEAHHEDSPAGFGAMGPLARHEFDHNARQDQLGHVHADTVQASNSGAAGLALARTRSGVSMSEREITLAVELIDYLEESGRHAEAAEAAASLAVELGHDPGALAALELATSMGGFPAGAGGYGGPPTIELANGQVVDLAPYQRFGDTFDAQRGHESVRRAEDARVIRRATGTSPSEERLTAALDRVRRGTLTPQGPARLGLDFSSVPGGVTGHATCGPADEFGYCLETYHDATCGSYVGDDVALAMIGNDVYLNRAASPWADESGKTWLNQYGLPMDLTQIIESVSGQRLANTSGDLFESGHGRAEAFRAQPVQVWGDPDDPDGAVTDTVPGAVSGLAAQVLAQAGIRTESAAAGRARLRDDPRRSLMQAAMARRMGDGGSETMRERAERVNGAAGPPVPDAAGLPNIYLSNTYRAPRGYRPPPSYGGLPGELPRFTWGDL